MSEKKHWWLLQRRTHEDSPYYSPEKPREWYTLRRYSDLDRARRGLDLDGGHLGPYKGRTYFEWQIIDEETGEVVA